MGRTVLAGLTRGTTLEALLDGKSFVLVVSRGAIVYTSILIKDFGGVAGEAIIGGEIAFLAVTGASITESLIGCICVAKKACRTLGITILRN